MKFSIADRLLVEINGKNTERFLNLCLKNGIRLYDISYDGSKTLFKISPGDFQLLRIPARRCAVRVKILKKQGALMFLRRRKRRYGFFAGAMAAVMIMVYLTSCIWVVDINGNSRVKSDEIMAALKRNGIYVGSLRYGHDIKKIQNNILLDLDSLAWLWVNIDGTRASVDIREKVTGEKVTDINAPYNLVASHGGYITGIYTRSGQKVVEPGCAVSKGDLLVSGISTTAYRGNRLIHSDAEVIAETWRKKSGEFNHTATEYLPTGKSVKKSTVGFPHFKIKLFVHNRPDYKLYEKSTKKQNIKIFGNIYLPITFTTDTFCEIIEHRKTISDSEALSAAVERICAEIENERAKGSSTLSREYEYQKLENGNIFVSVTVRSSENIAQPVKIELEDAKE